MMGELQFNLSSTNESEYIEKDAALKENSKQSEDYMQRLEEILKMMSGSISIVIAVIVAWIAWKQWKSSHAHLLLEIYDKRLSIYKEVNAYLGVVVGTSSPEIASIHEFKKVTAEADFLFANKIASKINEIVAKSFEMRNAKMKIQPNRPDSDHYNHQKACEEFSALENYFLEQTKEVKSLFEPYLKIATGEYFKRI